MAVVANKIFSYGIREGGNTYGYRGAEYNVLVVKTERWVGILRLAAAKRKVLAS
jgi:hypothetical protein